jgi:glycosyltransferase involved in cell wall biosynthesis
MHDAMSLLPVSPTAQCVVHARERQKVLAQPTRPGRYIKVRQLLFRGNALMLTPSVSVVVPALNEARNIPHVFAQIPADVYEVILVDGLSVDDTVATARQVMPDVQVVMQTRQGKGNALACGFAAATGDIIAMVDADGSADPSEIPRFVAALLDGADFAKGTRFAEGGGSGDITRLRSFGNYVLTSFFNACYGRSYSDLCYGFNVFWRQHLPVLGLDATSPSQPDGNGRLRGDGFEVETLIHVRVAKAGLVVAEVPSFEHQRIHGVSNLNAFRDGRRVVQTILAERRSSRRRPAVGEIEPLIRLLPIMAAQVVHESSFSSGTEEE